MASPTSSETKQNYTAQSSHLFLLIILLTHKSFSMQSLSYIYSSSLEPSSSSTPLTSPPSNSPPPASTRIVHPTPLSENLTLEWNAHIAQAFTSLHAASDSLADWGRNSLYGLGLGAQGESREGAEKGNLKGRTGKE